VPQQDINFILLAYCIFKPEAALLLRISYQNYMKPEKLSLIVLDKNTITRFTLTQFLLRCEFLFCQVIEVAQPESLLNTLRKHPVNWILINYESMPFDLSRHLKKLKSIFPETGVLAFNFRHSYFALVHLIKSGINAVVSESCPLENVLLLLTSLKTNEIHFNNILTQNIYRKCKSLVVDNLSDLKMIEVECIRLFCYGLTHEEIGNEFTLSTSRINAIFSDIHSKTGCVSLMDIVRFALIYNIIDWDEIKLSEKFDFLVGKTG
jgi:DNA-binding NarL/FixJ family response regulator